MGFGVVSLSLGNPGLPLGYGLPGHPQQIRKIQLRQTGLFSAVDDFFIQFHGLHLLPEAYQKRRLRVNQPGLAYAQPPVAFHFLSLQAGKLLFSGFTFKFSVIANQSADWCGNPPVRGKMYRIAPEKQGLLRFLAVIATWFHSTGGLPRQCAHWLAMTAFFRVRRCKQQFIALTFSPARRRPAGRCTAPGSAWQGR